MANTSLPASAKEATTRVQRGRDLYTEHADEIKFEDGVWFVPSQHEATSVYEVTLGRKGEFCECKDFEFRGEACKHILAATIAHAKTATCSGCGDRIRHRDLTEVTEDHESLTWFVGDLLCPECIRDHGGIA